MIGVERIAGAAVVRKMRAVLLQDVVSVVLEAAEAQRRPPVIALRGVIEDDVQNHFDAGAVQRLDHVAEFVDRAHSGSCREL